MHYDYNLHKNISIINHTEHIGIKYLIKVKVSLFIIKCYLKQNNLTEISIRDTVAGPNSAVINLNVQQISHFVFTVLQLQRKWRSLRDAYNRELRARRAAPRGNRRVYIYFKRMSFLGGFEGSVSDE